MKNLARREYCLVCWRSTTLCICDVIKPFATQCEVALLMHPMEAKRQRLGTGRLTKAAIEGTRLFYDVNLDEDGGFIAYLEDPRYHHVLLYPAENPEYIDQESIPNSWHAPLIKEGKILCLHFIDATWPMAKKMMRLSKRLQEMPKVSFKNLNQSRFIIKHQPHKACLSTIETTYHCLKGLKSMGLEPNLKNEHENLLQILDTLVSFQLKCEHDPNIKSTRGTKPRGIKAHEKEKLEFSRIREKKNRLFYWDVQKSEVGSREESEKGKQDYDK